MLKDYRITKDHYGYYVEDLKTGEEIDLGDGVLLFEEQLNDLFPGQNWKEKVVNL